MKVDDTSLNTTEITPEVIDYVVNKIATTVSPEKIILFGSQVSKKTDQGSDLDLFIIQDGSQSNRQVRREIELMLQERRFGLDLIVRTREEFELNVAYGNPFYVDVLLNSGQVVYERQ
jgi:predicted nucleotidyltransferase